MDRRTFLAGTAGVLAASAGAQARPRPPARARLIEWGWDSPTPRQVVDTLKAMEARPFDGVVLTIPAWLNDTTRADLKDIFWGRAPLTKNALAAALIDLKRTPFRKLTDNFAAIGMQPGDVTWQDNAGWDTICEKGALAAEMCREGGLKGLWFDTEIYAKRGKGTKPFDHYDLRTRGVPPFDETRALARRRGRDLAKAMTSAMPDMTLVLAWAWSRLAMHPGERGNQAEYALLPSFLDGILEGAGPNVKLVDGTESAYAARTRADFTRIRRQAEESRKYSALPDKYDARLSYAMPVWVDYLSHTNPWRPDAPEKNHYTPNQLRDAITAALEASDDYAWTWSERPNWWTGENLTPAYIKAVEEGVAAARRA